MKDAYDLLQEAQRIWQQQAVTKNDASALKKDNPGIDLWTKTPYGWYKINSVYFHPTYGIMLDHDENPTDKS